MTRSVKRLNPEQSITRSARRILRERLRVVWHYLKLAAKRCSATVEYVHQLRVATRRAEAALDIFQDLLPSSKLRWMRKTLRRLRKSAGRARDLDVLSLRLREISEQHRQEHFEGLLQQVARDRKKAQGPLLVGYRRAKAADFKHRSRKLARSVKWPQEIPEPTVWAAAKIRLAPLVSAFFTAADADLSDPRAMHAMRIRGKQLRYALELLGGAFDAGAIAEAHAVITQVQEKLGAINDRAVAAVTFANWQTQVESQEVRAVLHELVQSQIEQQQMLSREFRGWWAESQAIAFSRAIELLLNAPPASRSSNS